MRVLLTTDTVGGVWTFTRELAMELLNAGHAVALASFGREPSAHQRRWCEEMAAWHGRRFVTCASEAPLEWMQGNAECFARGERVLRDLCKRFAPDVVHASQFCWGALDVAVPKVVTAHSDVLSWAEACRGGKLEESGWLARYQRMVQEGLDGADAVTAPTVWMAEALGRNFYMRGDVRVIANGRSLRPVHAGERPLQAVSVGRLWDEAKGLRTLLEVKSAVPIVVAGEAEFEDEAAEMPVWFAGSLSEEEVLELFRQSAIYIAASVYEPFGLAPLEAALCGCAVVARDIPSLREVWGSAATYFRDVRELEVILEAFAVRPERLKAARGAAMRRAERYSAQAMATQYAALYEEVLSGAAIDGCEEEMVADAA